MNRLNFNQTGGFPLSTNILDAMQEAYSVFNSLGSLAGDKAIISGCVVAVNNVSDGVIYLNGEILSFKGGTLGATIIIKEESESRIFEDGATKPVVFKRYATFGSSTPEKTFMWADFKRFDNLIENATKNADFEERLKALETKKSPVPIGLIAIWGKPASEPIPEGWREYESLRGRFPLGWNPNDEEFNILLKEGGDKNHTLTTEEIPKHSHYTVADGRGVGRGRDYRNGIYTARVNQDNGDDDYMLSGTSLLPNIAPSSDVGAGQPHNNMPPYRIIKFIEFVGFN